jgi:NitT/TauT family transport system permease protein
MAAHDRVMAAPDQGVWAKRIRRFALAVAGFVLLALAWEGYKAFWKATSGKVLGWKLPATGDNISMPHVWTVWQRFGDPEVRGNSRTVGMAVLQGAWFTFRMAMGGFVIGVIVGLVLAVVMQRFKVAERGLLPFVILSQTVPLVALAPLIAGWGGNLHLPILGEWKSWMSVVVIAAYLAFFPVAVGGLRGLQSPSPASVELMRSYAASNTRTLWKLRFPAAVPYLVPALKLGAAAAVVGAVVAEISTGTRGGIGRLIIEYSREATSDPAKVYTAMIAAAALGLVVAALVSTFDTVAMRHRPKEPEL